MGEEGLLLDLGREGVLLVDCEKSHRFSFGLNLCLFVSFSSDRFLTLAFVRFERIVVRSPVLFPCLAFSEVCIEFLGSLIFLCETLLIMYDSDSKDLILFSIVVGIMESIMA